MTWTVTAEPSRLDEAVEWFGNRFPVTDQIAEELGEYAGPRAWKIAGVAQLEVVQQVHESIERAIASGIPLEQWQREIEDELTEAWGRRDSHRIETIFRNATQQSYNAGRWRQMTDPSVSALRPYGMYDAVVDSRTTPLCRAWDGTIRPIHEFAALGMCPQTHHRCRAGLRTLRTSDAERRGITEELPDDRAAEGFGRAPTESDWQPDPSKYDAALFGTYETKRSEIERDAERHRVPTRET